MEVGSLGTAAIVFAVVLGLLISFHELGHFILAKLSGVGVSKFSLGFGPRLWGVRYGETEYVVAAIPLGGYVKMIGEEPEENGGVDPEKSFLHKPLRWRALIVAAGPLFNVLLAVLLFSGAFWWFGLEMPANLARVGGVDASLPAGRAGLRPGDDILAINGRAISTWQELFEAVRGSGGRALRLRIRRAEGGRLEEMVISPVRQEVRNLFGEVTDTVYLLGIRQPTESRTVGPIGAVVEGTRRTIYVAEITVISLVKMIRGRVSAREIGGPIMIAQEATRAARRGLEPLLHFIAVVSVNLGVLNLLPIPILDGGHLVFFLIEVVRRRPLNVRQREIAQQVGLVLLVALMFFAFYNDISRLVQG